MARKGDTIIVAIDDSANSMDALQFYVDHLHKEENKVVLVHSVEIPYQPVQRVVSVQDSPKGTKRRVSPAEKDKLVEAIRQEIAADIVNKAKGGAREVENKCTKFLREKGIQHEVKTEISHPGEYICKAATDLKAAMVVMGTRGMGKIRRTILGSVSDYVVHHAPCPVFICRHT